MAVPHGDHVDYVHDGHLHHRDGEHWGECTSDRCVEHRDHTHQHGPNCGHVAIEHGDHVDYLHDGHLHASHAGHWDEH